MRTTWERELLEEAGLKCVFIQLKVVSEEEGDLNCGCKLIIKMRSKVF